MISLIKIHEDSIMKILARTYYDLLSLEVRSNLLNSFLVRYNLQEDETVGFDVASKAFKFEASKQF